MSKKIYSVYAKAPEKPQELFGEDKIVFREEQVKAITEARKHFEKKEERQQFLWNAKMRFGKTLCALELARQMSETQKNNRRVKRVLIVTHRPVVNESWKEDFEKIFGKNSSCFKYGTKFDNDFTGNFFDLEKHANRAEENGYVFFASMQYLRRSNLVNDKVKYETEPQNERLRNSILENDWDFVVVDEAHEGTITTLGSRVIHVLKKEKTKLLHLSGTPFNLYEDFGDDEIFNWDYVKEQQAKKEWDSKHPGEYNPYAVLPHMNIFTYDLAKLVKGEDFSADGSFKFTEFFRTWTGNPRKDGAEMPEGVMGCFIHEKEVKDFLDLMCKEDDDSNYPFSKEMYQENFNHTLWIVPGVPEAKALTQLLREHDIFGNFEIINVAGNSDDDEKCDNALDSVLSKIGKRPSETATITISCGRLTTGVTVPQWTAVMYLKGSENTSAATYMQTIFRVQSVDTKTYPGKMKAECYVFDFAPDRSLKMIAETAKFANLTKKEKNHANTVSKEDDIARMEEFMNFFAVVSLDGGQMRAYDAESLFKQLDHVYIDRVVRNGFNDNMIYDSSYLMNLNESQLKRLNELGDIIEKTTNMEKPKKAASIQMADNDLKDKAKKAKQKQKEGKQLTPEERAAIEEERKRREEERKEKENRISILRGIALRIPLLIYGANVDDEEIGITINNLTDRIDDASWGEFMPRGITKEIFEEIKPCFNAKMFALAGKRYRQLAREADEMHTDERVKRIAEIFSYFHNPDKETVLTPWRVVNMHMSDTLGGYCFFNEKFDGPNQKVVDGICNALFDFIDTTEPRFVNRGEVTANVFSTDSKILEINSKTGLYPLYVTYSIYRQRMKDFANHGLIKDIENYSIEEEQVIWDDIIKNNIYVICNTPMAARITERTLLGFRPISQENIKEDKLIEQATTNKDELVEKLQTFGYWNGTDDKTEMKFNAVVGNPPYQLMDTNRSEQPPIYHHFYDIAFELAPRVSLISPARFLANAGKTPMSWNLKMLNDKHFKVVNFFSNSKDVFPTVDIKGGVAITMRDINQDYGKICEFIPNDNLRNILSLVRPDKGLDSIMYSNTSYKFSDLFFKEHPEFESRVSGGSKRYLASPSFNVFPEVFFETKPNDGNEYIEIIGRQNNERLIYYFNLKYLTPPNNYNKYKVFVAASNGTGAIGEKLSTPFVAKPYLGYTETFVSFGCFDKEEEAEALLKYIKSKFARALLATKKITQSNKASIVWSNIPIQDFSESSDIDWSKSIGEIDQQLYKKYELSDDEVNFIENKILAME